MDVLRLTAWIQDKDGWHGSHLPVAHGLGLVLGVNFQNLKTVFQLCCQLLDGRTQDSPAGHTLLRRKIQQSWPSRFKPFQSGRGIETGISQTAPDATQVQPAQQEIQHHASRDQ
jgi:hypothetical protein